MRKQGADGNGSSPQDVYPVPEEIKKRAYISGRKAYDELYRRSIDNPSAFWGEVAAQYVTCFKKWDVV